MPMSLRKTLLATLLASSLAQKSDGGGGGGSSGTTCSSNVAALVGTPTAGACNSFTNNVVTPYPSGFSVLNTFAHYECPTSGLRIIRANGVPDHEVTNNNPVSACDTPWQYTMSLTPTTDSAGPTEPMALGVVGVAANGVPIYGAQEGGGENAVEPTGSITDAQYWWGHAATNGDTRRSWASRRSTPPRSSAGPWTATRSTGRSPTTPCSTAATG